MVSLLPVYVLLLQLIISLVGLYEFAGVHGLRPSRWSALWLLVAYFPFQWLLAYSALRAGWRQARGINTWEKTAHIGAHRAGPVAAPVRRAAP
jgi:hypothetical protein